MLQPWELNFQIERSSGTPLYRQVAQTVVERVGKGLLAPGTPLPGTRSLAKLLGVHRNTVKAAYDELLAGGWITTTPSRGTFVAARSLEASLRSSSSRAHGLVRQNGQALVSPLTMPLLMRDGESEALAGLPYRRTLICNDGSPDIRLAPDSEFSRALRRALKSPRVWCEQDHRGHAGLRTTTAEMLRLSRAIPAEPDEILITSGQRMSLYLIARALLADRSTIAVEQPGNKAAWEVFGQCGMRVIGIPVDDEGLRVDYLASQPGVDAVYVTPACQYPTTVRMSVERRMQLLNWSRQTGAQIVEYDSDREFEFDGLQALPLASMDSSASIIHIGSFTRIFAPSIEPVYIRASRSAIARLSRARSAIGRCGDHPLEAALYDLAAEGVLRRQLRRVQGLYRERRDHLALCLKKEFGSRLKFIIPGGGLALWIEPTASLSPREWTEAARRLGVRFFPPPDYWLERPSRGGLRVGFAALSHEELAAVASTLRQSLPVSKNQTFNRIQQESAQLRRCIA